MALLHHTTELAAFGHAIALEWGPGGLHGFGKRGDNSVSEDLPWEFSASGWSQVALDTLHSAFV